MHHKWRIQSQQKEIISTVAQLIEWPTQISSSTIFIKHLKKIIMSTCVPTYQQHIKVLILAVGGSSQSRFLPKRL